jgi:hypothetical protein
MTAVRHVILSLDYEVFGNGSGEVECCVLRPAENIAAITERHGARLSVFVDALEFEAMQRLGQVGAAAVRRQLQDLMLRGHRLELHLHPQWDHNASLGTEGWQLDPCKWRIGDLMPDAARACIERGYAWLTDLMHEVDPSAQPLAFRAGGWAIQPSDAVLPALQALGVAVESSVAPGLHNRQPTDWFDFRNAPGRAWWPISHDVCRVEPKGRLHEVPIAVGQINRLRHFRLWRASRGRLASGCCGSYDSGSNRWQKLQGALSKLGRIGNAMLDYSLLDAETLADVTQHWVDRWPAETIALPVVAIGHTKNFSAASADALDHYLGWLCEQPQYRFSDYASLHAAIT